MRDADSRTAGPNRGRDSGSGYYCPPFASRLNSGDILPGCLPPWIHSPQSGRLRIQLGSCPAAASGRWSQRPRLPLEVWRMPARWPANTGSSQAWNRFRLAVIRKMSCSRSDTLMELRAASPSSSPRCLRRAEAFRRYRRTCRPESRRCSPTAAALSARAARAPRKRA